MLRIFRFILTFLFTVLLLNSCERESRQRLSPAAQELIAGHTAGLISRESSIRIEFNRDIADSTVLDAALARNPFRFSPSINGYATWTTPRTLVFRPENRLPDGTEYEARVDLKAIDPNLFAGDVFKFSFTTLRQSFELEISGLSYLEAGDLTRQRIEGELVTADVEDGNLVSRILSAGQEDHDLPIKWDHDPGRRTHRFIIGGIERKSTATSVIVKWDGDPIGVDQKGERTIDITPLSEFELTDARAVRDVSDYIELRFSDPLLINQQLDGLIKIEGIRKPGFEIEQNVIKVFSSSPLNGDIDITVTAGIRNSMGYRFGRLIRKTVTFSEIKPQVRFIGKGAILPANLKNVIPVEAVNLRAVIIEAIQIFESNIPQFLQVNNLDGDREIKRVARPVWKDTIQLDPSPDKRNRWVRYGLDISRLVKQYPKGLFRLAIYFGYEHIDFECDTIPGKAPRERQESWDADSEDEYGDEDYYEAYNWYEYYQQRFNPCHPAYYRSYYDHNIRVERNILISDIGLLAKQGTDQDLFIAVSNLGTADPVRNAGVKVFNYQHQMIADGVTGENGTTTLKVTQKPFLVTANSEGQTGYLKLDEASSEPVGHFDVGGEEVREGIKGFFYGERGVWRPGDTMYITFILHDPEKRLPSGHPVVFEVRDARGQLIQTIRRTKGLNGFYALRIETDPDAPTGNWQIRARAGANVYEKNLRVEAIIPNRLKIDLDFGNGERDLTTGQIEGILTARWLHGAVARNLDADIEMTINSTRTIFKNLRDFSFDDPVRRFEPEQIAVFKGAVDSKGEAHFSKNISVRHTAPGMLRASFQVRVFEKSGAFSTDRFDKILHPYKRYVGVHVAGDDDKNQILVTDSTHRVDIAVVNTEGNQVSSASVEMRLYRIKWRWWWQKGEDALADYIGTENFQPLKTDTVDLTHGRGTWMFKINYPDWGRYLVQAKDLDGGHTCGEIVYVDWPGWARKSRREEPGGATVLSITSDKSSYKVGEEVEITIPTAFTGRGLVSIESGSEILKSDWITGNGETARYRFRTTAGMTPNVYVNVTYIQPVGQESNDLPVRLYGIIPIGVYDPETTLKPKISAPEVMTPEQTSVIRISEQNGQPMTYTLAVVDEGLLDLTHFGTPDPWSYFYSREALGVRTWDLYDQVIGAFGGRFERLLSIGGGEETPLETGRQAQRFPPMVRFLGPFSLEGGGHNEHKIDIPQYVGSVRIMVVGGNVRAYGSAEATVPVRKPLMILATLPRVLGTGEEVKLPVSVFALEDRVKNVVVHLSVKGPVALTGAGEKNLTFSETGDKMVTFDIVTGDTSGIGEIRLVAESGSLSARQDIAVGVRSPSLPVVEVKSAKIAPGDEWSGDLNLPGMAGTNTVWLEISRIPPLDLSRRLRYLINYPYGCIEQTVSAAFPQIFLPKLVSLTESEDRQTKSNVRSAIERVQRMQAFDGGFNYWPGAASSDDWSTSYAGHFLIEAENGGYTIPMALKDNWIRFQRNRARSWTTGTERSLLLQAYRLFTLALAGKPELGAMNRLREERELNDVTRWNLAAAYKLAGFEDAAREIVNLAGTDVEAYTELSGTYGSGMRDRALILSAMTIIGDLDQSSRLAEKLSADLCSDRWYSTQTTAQALIALAHFAGVAGPVQPLSINFAWMQQGAQPVEMNKPVLRKEMTVTNLQPVFRIQNPGGINLYTRFVMEGLPAAGAEKSGANGLALEITYRNADGSEADLNHIGQGSDLTILIRVRNTGTTGNYQELALSHLIPAGWEIRNPRMETVTVARESPYTYRDYRDDRVYTYFDLNARSEKNFRLNINAAYAGKYYLPMVNVEAMYDATIYARQAGRWITVYRPEAAEK